MVTEPVPLATSNSLKSIEAVVPRILFPPKLMALVILAPETLMAFVIVPAAEVKDIPLVKARLVSSFSIKRS